MKNTKVLFIVFVFLVIPATLLYSQGYSGTQNTTQETAATTPSLMGPSGATIDLSLIHI